MVVVHDGHYSVTPLGAIAALLALAHLSSAFIRHPPLLPQHRCRQLARLMSSVTEEPPAKRMAQERAGGSAGPADEDGQDGERKKRRAALVFGYLGTKYFGLQKSTIESDELRTVEGTLEKALYKAGYIRDSNFGDLDKAGSFEDTAFSEEAVHEINQSLPDDIRVFSCTKVGKGFRPRDACSFREYEYILPLTMLRPLGPGAGSAAADFDVEEAIATFFRIVRKFEGTHNFHNFTKLKTRELLKKLSGAAPYKDRRAKWNKAPGDENGKAEDEGEGGGGGEGEEEQDQLEEEEETEAGEAREDRDPSAVHVTGSRVVDRIRYFNTDIGLNPLFLLLKNRSPDAKSSIPLALGDPEDGMTASLWDLTRHRGILKMVRSNIFKSEGRVFEEGGGRYVAVSFRGQSFLYNQIRLMIGAALAVVTGLIPEEALDAALSTPYMVYSPLAPAEGLYLKSLTFGRQTRNTVVLDEGARQELQAQGYDSDVVLVLMPASGVAMAADFEAQQVVPTVVGSWSSELVEGWLDFASRYHMKDDVRATLSAKCEAWKASMEELQALKAGRELQRRQSAIQSPEQTERQHLYRRVMPQRFATDLIIKYRLKPGKQVADIQRALGERILKNEVPMNASTEELFAIVDRLGVEALAQEGKTLFMEGGGRKRDEPSAATGPKEMA